MSMEFADGMRAAMRLIRTQKLMEATRVIQSVLAGEERAATPNGPGPRAIEGHIIDLTAEVVEPGAEELAEPEVMPALEGEATSPSGLALPPRIVDWARRIGEMVQAPGDTGLSGFGVEALARARPSKIVDVPDGAQFLSRSFSCAAGSRNYKLYIPSRRQESGCALVVMLHGGTQDGDDFAAGTRMNDLAEEHGFIVAYPNQSKAANASLCWNWFTPEHQERGAGEPSIIAGITREIVASYDVDPDRVFIAGLSAGGAMAAVMAATYPEMYAALGVHSGLPYRSAADLPSAFAAMRGNARSPRRRSRKLRGAAADSPRLRTIVFHGDADKIVHASNAAGIVAESKAGESIEHAQDRSSAGRPYTRTVIRDQSGMAVVEQWLLHGSGHAWSGGSPDGSYTDPHGPDASCEMLRFFLETGGDRRP
ncbi:MAG TPA: PHB depolymerase family esterase [Methyloceanibacter sp.]|nr:PHB depolymerase family esterase [Methyloceanibacter sp.]